MASRRGSEAEGMFRAFQFVCTFLACAYIGGLVGGFVGAALSGWQPTYDSETTTSTEVVGAVAGLVICGTCWLISWVSTPSSVEFRDRWQRAE